MLEIDSWKSGFIASSEIFDISTKSFRFEFRRSGMNLEKLPYTIEENYFRSKAAIF